jgi:glyoxylase-like metal-dependent hydrolase (beta-lactamase superfamily II)
MTDPIPGRLERVGTSVRRLLAPNPSPFTFHGTQTYVVGEREVAVIDPGPDISRHIDALMASLAGETVAVILCTHTHADHSPASRRLQAATNAPIVGCAPLVLDDDGPRSDDAFDTDYRPDRIFEDGERLSLGALTIEAVATPGHTSNHLCFALADEGVLFSGDHVMGWSTTVVSPPDGDMADYMMSLEKLLFRRESVYFPAHGDPIEDPQRHVRRLIGHRRQRASQVLRCLESGEDSVPQIVGRIYKGLDPRLTGAAGRSVLAHLVDLERRGSVVRKGERWTRAV